MRRMKTAVPILVLTATMKLMALDAPPQETPSPPRENPLAEPIKNGATQGQKNSEKEPQPQAGTDLRSLIGVNAGGAKRTEGPRLPVMSLRGFVKPHGQSPLALIEIAEFNRTFLVQVGSEIPITIASRLLSAGREELTGLSGSSKSGPARSADSQSQIILKVTKVNSEGVTVEAEQLGQVLIIR